MDPIDSTKPNIARVWDYWLGGKDNFAVDRELAEKLLEVHPPSAQMAQENRRFLGRAVSYVAACGIWQFIDVGAGLPTALNTHDIAQQVSSRARVAYVDNDPMVISHARGLLAKSPGVIAVPGDMREPERILDDPGLAELIDLGRPSCVILSGVLHFLDAQAAREVAAAFARAISPASYLIISVGSGNPAEGKKPPAGSRRSWRRKRPRHQRRRPTAATARAGPARPGPGNRSSTPASAAAAWPAPPQPTARERSRLAADALFSCGTRPA